ncbi:MAG TPA: sigma-70 family RNA polymerase sigma factor [Anaerolineae bacterium]|nr:sigma-70 family RNA polymerase sigma factor [Anaerolineae bacterium]
MSEPLDDMELVARVAEDPSAFGELYERYVTKIYNYVYYRTGNYHDAEDLTGRVFYRALMHIDRFVDRGVPFSAWLYRIAHNLVANWHRDHARRQEYSLEDLTLTSPARDTPEATTEANEERLRLLQAIRNLPPERQELLILKFVEHLSNADIGQIMGRSEGAIKSLYHRTLLSLRDELATSAVDDLAGSVDPSSRKEHP